MEYIFFVAELWIAAVGLRNGQIEHCECVHV